MILILGASGYVGRHLYDYLLAKGVPAAGTYGFHQDNDLLPFRLGERDYSIFAQQRFSHVVFCAASFATIDESCRNFEQAYDENVTCVKESLDVCFQRGIVPVYVSTDNVFDGTIGNYAENTPSNPVNCYGRIRAEVERHLLSNDAPHVILRISKVFGCRMGDGTLISDLCSRLLRDEMVRCAEDQNLSPIFVEELCWLIGTIVGTGYTGTLHAASMDPVTRYALATHIASVLKVGAGKIVPCNINELGLLEPRPVDTSLNDSLYRHTFGVEHKDMAYYIRHVLEEHGKGTS